LDSSRIRGVIFDMDGTLVSTQSVIVHCVNEMARKYLKRPLRSTDPLWRFGPPAGNVVKSFANVASGVSAREAVDEYYSCYRANFLDKSLLFPEIPGLLQGLRNAGRRLGVVTVEEGEIMRHNLDMLGLAEYFDCLVSRDDVKKPKPDPEGLRLALRNMGTRPEDSVIVGDSAADISAGKSAGLVTILAEWAPQFVDNVSSVNPDYRFQKITDLSKFLLTGPVAL
jgi:HAD superfamily hydrolase (TIGR01509 family)